MVDVEEAARPRCRCGFDRDGVMVSAEAKYSGWGWFWVTFVGVTSTPTRVDFRCRVCNETFDTEKDPAQLRRYV